MSNQPTAADKRRFSKLVEVGCVACKLEGMVYTYPQIHHARIGTSRRDHQRTFGVCGIHHLATSAVPGIPNRHGSPKDFRETYGTDDELLTYVNGLIK